MRPATKTGFELTGFHILMLFGAFFGVIIAVNLFMARAAVVNWTGLVVKNSYVASQQFNEKIAAHDAIAARGWTEAATVEGGALKWALTDAAGKPVAVTKLTVQLNRPIGVEDDATVEAAPLADGSFAPLPLPGPGRWVATIRAELPGMEPLESVHRFEIPAKG